jgi:hypothetical protein
MLTAGRLCYSCVPYVSRFRLSVLHYSIRPSRSLWHFVYGAFHLYALFMVAATCGM